MNDDLIERLRDLSRTAYSSHAAIAGAATGKAADEIARLRAEVERLTAHAEAGWDQYQYWSKRYSFAADERDKAEAALSDERRHADALAEALLVIAGGKYHRAPDSATAATVARAAFDKHRARRQPKPQGSPPE